MCMSLPALPTSCNTVRQTPSTLGIGQAPDFRAIGGPLLLELTQSWFRLGERVELEAVQMRVLVQMQPEVEEQAACMRVA